MKLFDLPESLNGFRKCVMIERHSRLTKREAEVVRWILLGFTSKEVSRILRIAPQTTETHISNVKMRLGVKTRAHMATEVILRNLVSLTVEDLDGLGRPADEEAIGSDS